MYISYNKGQMIALRVPRGIVGLDEGEALELHIIEDLHRSDVHELGEAFGYMALMGRPPKPRVATVEGIRARRRRAGYPRQWPSASAFLWL
jgi:hypothetical protein